MSWLNRIWEEMNRPLGQCPMCKGDGKRQIGQFERECPVCHGTGQNPNFKPYEPTLKPPNPPFWSLNKCPDCEGEGWVYIASSTSFFRSQKKQRCNKCQGRGFI